MKTIEILGENRFAEQTKTRVACRGIVLSEGKILLTYEVNTDQYFIPGGGLESDEGLEECCARELAEETGYVVKPIRQYLTIHEYYEEWFFVSHYFICEVVSETTRALTEREAEAGLETRWIPLKEAVEIFGRHQEYAETDEMKRGAYLREYEALLELTKR
ncbi:MAG: NUDIX domain-containing protein [Lachnospiraceae bacterium]|nr:NUDIX domain-containing protein [Lachnospiraceae bacterium]